MTRLHWSLQAWRCVNKSPTHHTRTQHFSAYDCTQNSIQQSTCMLTTCILSLNWVWVISHYQGSPNRTRSGLPTPKKPGGKPSKPPCKSDSTVLPDFLGAVGTGSRSFFKPGRTGNRLNWPGSHQFGEPWSLLLAACHTDDLLTFSSYV
jgi:hypothetical protein